MCGRFASALKLSDAWLELMQEWSDELFNRYNVSPASQIGAFVEGRCHAMRWGLVPSWSREISSKYATFNARIESIESKPAFRSAWQKNQKCLIPALGYYEWQTEEGLKQPYFVTSYDEQPLVFAGLWDECMIGDGKLTSCTIITTESKDELASLHDRMPVMLGVDSARRWLDVADDKELLLDECRTDFKVYKVDRRVNNSRQEDESLVEPI
jgi:putative SOS response-associated peptidase YedK